MYFFQYSIYILRFSCYFRSLYSNCNAGFSWPPFLVLVCFSGFSWCLAFWYFILISRFLWYLHFYYTICTLRFSWYPAFWHVIFGVLFSLQFFFFMLFYGFIFIALSKLNCLSFLFWVILMFYCLSFRSVCLFANNRSFFNEHSLAPLN